jgi:hypothetical protein
MAESDEGVGSGSAGGAARYEPPRLTVHGTVAEVTEAQVVGTNFDRSIPAGSSIVAIFGSTSF